MIAEHAIASRSYVIETMGFEYAARPRPLFLDTTAAPGIAHDWSFGWDPQPNIVYPGPDDDNSGDDHVVGTDEGDTINGGAGDDTIRGKGANDLLNGGEEGDDSVAGDDGDDIIQCNGGDDDLYGGDGNDTIEVRGTSSAFGGGGDDTLHLGAFNGIDIGEAVDEVFSILGGTGTDLLMIGSLVSFEIDEFDAEAWGLEVLEVGAAITGDDGDNDFDFSSMILNGTHGLQLIAQAGDDRLIGLDDPTHGDTLDGGDDNDVLFGGGGPDTLIAGPGLDELYGGDAADTLYGGEAAQDAIDLLQGDGGNDVINATGHALAVGGDGDDKIFLTNAFAGAGVLGGSVGGFDDGTADELHVGSGTVFTALKFNFGKNGFEILVAPAPITGDAQNNTLDFSTAQRAQADLLFFGQNGDDRITGTTQRDIIHGEQGDDVLAGHGGMDALFGDIGDDKLYAGDAPGNGRLPRDAGAPIPGVQLDGGADTDIIFGGAGDDTITDTDKLGLINAGKGDDTVELKTALVLNSANLNGGGGADTLLSTFDTTMAGFNAAEQNFEIVGGVINGTSGKNTIDLTGAANANAMIQQVFASGGKDDIKASAASARLEGQDGNDKLFATGANSLLNGGANNDKCTAQGSGSTVLGGDGDDTLMCSAVGTYTIDGGLNSDVIDFSWAHTGIAVDLGNAAAQDTHVGTYTMSNVENVNGSDEDDTIKGSNAANVLNGADGADTLIGGVGADTLTGGSDNDKFVYNAQNEGGDTLTAFGSGGDKFQFLGSAFGGLAAGAIAENQFQSDISNTALTATVRFFYETDTGILRFDADGSATGSSAVIIATIQGEVTMAFGDIEII